MDKLPGEVLKDFHKEHFKSVDEMSEILCPYWDSQKLINFERYDPRQKNARGKVDGTQFTVSDWMRFKSSLELLVEVNPGFMTKTKMRQLIDELRRAIDYQNRLLNRLENELVSEIAYPDPEKAISKSDLWGMVVAYSIWRITGQYPEAWNEAVKIIRVAVTKGYMTEGERESLINLVSTGRAEPPGPTVITEPSPGPERKIKDRLPFRPGEPMFTYEDASEPEEPEPVTNDSDDGLNKGLARVRLFEEFMDRLEADLRDERVSWEEVLRSVVLDATKGESLYDLLKAHERI